MLTLYDGSGSVVAQNDNWRDTQAAEISASGIPPGDESEAAIIATVEPGSYTAVVQDRTDGEGVALVEIYDLDPAADSTLRNISTRAMVAEGDNVMIGGFILRGAETSRVIVRALGPSLAAVGVSKALPDPIVTVYDQSGVVVASNDNWKQTQQTELETIGMGPSDEREAAMLIVLPPGSYSAVVHGADSQHGVGLIELYRD